MRTIRRINNVSCQWPSRPVGLIEIIGGSYISIKPEVTYKKLISGLLQSNFAVHAWSYIPNFVKFCFLVCGVYFVQKRL